MASARWIESNWKNWNQTLYIQASNTTTTAYLNNYLDNTWKAWNQIGTNSTGSIRYNTTASNNTYYLPSWTWWNEEYEETAEQKRKREEREREQKLALARETAIMGGRLTDAQKALLTDDELRNWEDAVQRRAEEELERVRARERAAAEEKERWEAAEAKAERLLVSLLDAEGKREWLEHRRVSVTAPSGRQYRLFPTWAGGVALMGEGDARVATLCVHPRERVPGCDVIVGNMLAIQHSEEHVLKIAIIHDGALPADAMEIRRGRQVVRERVPGGGGIDVPVAEVA